MREKQGLGLFQIGVALAVFGVAVHLALTLGRVFAPLANIALLVGVILIIVGLVWPGKR